MVIVLTFNVCDQARRGCRSPLAPTFRVTDPARREISLPHHLHIVLSKHPQEVFRSHDSKISVSMKMEQIDVTKRATPSPAANRPGATKASTEIRGQTLRLNQQAWRTLKLLSVDQGVTAHTLLIEAVNDMFQKYGKPPVA